jgi:hypothetical protein
VVGAPISPVLTPCAASFCALVGVDPLHSVQFLFVCNSTHDLTTRFTVSSLKFFPKIRPGVFSFLRHNCRPALGSFIPMLPSGSTRHIFPGVRSLWAPVAALFSARPFVTKSPLRRATAAQRVVPLGSATNCFRGPHFIVFRSCVQKCLLSRATVARRVSLCGLRPNSSGTHPCPGSVPVAFLLFI